MITNNIEVNELYMTERKENFLKQYTNDNTQRAFIRIFRRTSLMENALNKELAHFTSEELDKFYTDCEPSTEISARNLGRMINQYLKWSVENGIITEHPFPVQQHYFLRYVKKENEEFLTIKELKYYTSYYFKNLQDGIILEALFFGIQGKEGSELCNLSINDLDEDNKRIRLYDSVTKRERFLENVDSSFFDYCRNANLETEYQKRNGEIEFSSRIKPHTELIMDIPYVLKNSKTNTTHEAQATKYTIYNRLKNIQKFEEVEPLKHKITIKNIVKSGQLYMASQIYKEEGEIGLEQIRKIANYFGVKEHWSMRDYLNKETLLKVYPSLKSNK